MKDKKQNKELDPDYYSDKENPKPKDNADFNRNENPDEIEGVAPNR
ncbi:hypothetical protein GV828_08150 [Flavobacterium sp. NST-5]|uniref:Uncharacterized protein n=1 Tax=Flavobacterium ichthyis TaxID=2698827 RepID=A0ABW9Z9B7_9FLAO|nr:hypothetical protein [Flavobacterium ichthyis]NBL65167.1 hypothetical protein [Flavobacterium ichthyis]